MAVSFAMVGGRRNRNKVRLARTYARRRKVQNYLLRGWTQQDIADKLGSSIATINKELSQEIIKSLASP